ncbi:MAG TPA: YciI family protein [Actinomycetota bacterium]|nr:YciI family protein [Actinomycetota bacterium]
MKYLLILHGAEGDEQVNLSREEMTERMKAWDAYTNAVVEAGVYVAGEGLYPSSAATTVRHQPGGERILTDGPFVETKEQIGGFYLLQCTDLDEALEWAKRVPVQEGSAVEVRPVMDFSEFGHEHPDVAARSAG